MDTKEYNGHAHALSIAMKADQRALASIKVLRGRDGGRQQRKRTAQDFELGIYMIVSEERERDGYAQPRVGTRSRAVCGSRGDGGIGRRGSGRNLDEASRRRGQGTAWATATDQVLRTIAHCRRHCATTDVGDIQASTISRSCQFGDARVLCFRSRKVTCFPCSESGMERENAPKYSLPP